MHTGNLLLEELKGHGVRHIFGLPGEQTLPLYDALRNDPEGTVRHVGMRDERNLPYAALAYSRVSGRVGVLDVTVGPGTAMLPLGLLEAERSATPLFAIVSDVPVEFQPKADVGAISQGMDQQLFLGPITKWTSKAWTQDQVVPLTRIAFQEAASGRPGPTAVIVPQDIFKQEGSEPADLPGLGPGAGSYPRHRTVPDSASLEAAADLLLRAERPVLVAGGGVLHSGAARELVALSEHIELPVATTLTGKGGISEEHPLALGVLGDLGSVAAGNAARAADLLVYVGFRSAQNSTFKWTLPSDGQKAIHIDIDPQQPGRFLPCDVPLVGDARATLEALLAVLRRRESPAQRSGWLNRVDAWKEEWEQQVAEESSSDEVPILPQRVIAELVEVSDPEDVLVSDASFSSGWAAVYYRIRQEGRRVVLPRGMAGLGFGLPAAVGAKAALPDRNVFMLAGDGGFAYSLGELITLKEHGLKVISVVLNNRSWGWMEWVAKLNYGREYFSLPDVAFAEVAKAMGLRGERVNQPEDLKPALMDALEAPESAVIEVESAVWEAPIPAYRDALARQPEELAGAVGSVER